MHLADAVVIQVLAAGLTNEAALTIRTDGVALVDPAPALIALTVEPGREPRARA